MDGWMDGWSLLIYSLEVNKRKILIVNKGMSFKVNGRIMFKTLLLFKVSFI
jgi:hypothetical protein